MFSRWCPHSAAAPGMQRKVIYCCTKTWANQKVKFITKDNSCFHNSRSLSQKLCCVCSLGSRQQNKRQPDQALQRGFGLCCHFQMVPAPGIYIYYLYIYCLHSHSLPQPLKTSILKHSPTLTGLSRRPRVFLLNLSMICTARLEGIFLFFLPEKQ